jgi:excisionase family DNA binding protein
MTESTKTASLSALEAAQELGIRLGYLYTVLREGKIKAQRVDGEWQVDRSSVEEYETKRARRAVELAG